QRFLWTLVIGCLAVPQLQAAELKLLPGDITLTGPHASQRLLAVTATGGVVDGDVSDRAEFVSSNAKVATVDAEGVVQAVGDGETTITALAGKDKTTIQVRVQATKEPFTWS